MNLGSVVDNFHRLKRVSTRAKSSVYALPKAVHVNYRAQSRNQQDIDPILSRYFAYAHFWRKDYSGIVISIDVWFWYTARHG